MEHWEEIRAWRGRQRAALIARREALGDVQRAQFSERINLLLEHGFAMLARTIVGLCWPYRGEFDARFIAHRWRMLGAVTALPEVVGKAQPLRFRKWWPGAPMRTGVYGIPFPDGTEIVTPDAVLVPMNAFDECGYRIGYGGGYFDCTLAACHPRPLSIGISFEALRLKTIFPQPHDVPMDFVVTETAIYASDETGLAQLEPVRAAERALKLMAERRLPRAAAQAHGHGFASPPCYAGEFPEYFKGGGDKN